MFQELVGGRYLNLNKKTALASLLVMVLLFGIALMPLAGAASEDKAPEKDSKENIEQTHFFKEGDEVMVIDGSFKNFEGIVENVNPEKRVIKILIIIFGRQTPVELDFNQVKIIETRADEKI